MPSIKIFIITLSRKSNDFLPVGEDRNARFLSERGNFDKFFQLSSIPTYGSSLFKSQHRKTDAGQSTKRNHEIHEYEKSPRRPMGYGGRERKNER